MNSAELWSGNVRLAGETAGAGPTILLLHAGGENRSVWRPVMADLAAGGFSSIAYDQRGHGESGGAAADGVIAYGEDAKAMIRALDRPVVVGASLGGFALMLALEELEPFVAGLVLVDVTPAPDPERTRHYLAPRGELSASPLVEDILSRSGNFTHIVGKLKLPVLLVCGGARSPLGDDGQAVFAGLCQHADIQVIRQASHLVARDAPSELAALIGEFASRVTGAAANGALAGERAGASGVVRSGEASF